MENVLPRYRRPIPSIGDPVITVEHWDKAIEAYDEGDFRQSVLEVLRYINPTLLENKDTSQDFEIVQMQGTSEIHVSIKGDEFSVKAPFLKITEETNRVALLRRVGEVNFSPLGLASIVLYDDELWFEYEMPLTVCQPHKVYDLLHEVCVYSDDFDDQFIERYKASFYGKPKITPLTEKEQEEVWSQISDIFEDYHNYTQFFIDKRWTNYQWDNLVISLLKLSNMPYVQGKLRSDLIEYIRNLFNGDLDFQFRVDKGVNFMKKLSAKPKEEIMKNVYHAEQFISLRWRSSEQIITDRLKGNLEQVQRYEKEKSYFNLSYYLQFTLLKLIYDFNLEESYRKAIEEVMEEVSGLEPDQAAGNLLKVYYDLYEGRINAPDTSKKTKKGFFSKLFN